MTTQTKNFKERLLTATLSVSAMTFLSRISGFVRDMVLATIFGAGVEMDAFLVAFRIPNFLRRLFAEGAFSQGFVPVFAECHATRSDQEIGVLLDRVTGTLAVIVALVSLLGVLGAPWLMLIFAPGFSQHSSQYQLATEMLRITFPYLFFISLVSLSGGVLNTYHRFAAPAITPIFLNLAMIATALWLAPYLEVPITSLAWGTLLAGIVQLLFQWPFLYQIHRVPRPRFAWHDEGVKKILKLMVPAIIGSSAAQLGLLLDTLIASFLPHGSVSWLYYSDRLMEFPLGIFGVALATVLLPKLSKDHASQPERWSHTLAWGMRWGLVIGIPAMMGLFILAGPLLITFFYRQAFSVEDVRMSMFSLCAFAIGLPAFIMVKILSSSFYARQDTRTPVRFALIALSCNLGLNLTLLAVATFYHLPASHAGLALATSLAAYLNAFLLWRRLVQLSIFPEAKQIQWLAIKIAVITFLLGSLLVFLSASFEAWLSYSNMTRLSYLLGLIILTLMLYAISLRGVGVWHELKE